MVRSFIFKLTAEISVFTQISVTQVTVDGRVSVLKSAMLLSKPPSGRGVENIPQGIFKGGEREYKQILRVSPKRVLC